MSEIKKRKINAARVCFGISRIGYTPSSAICDIIDNSVSAHAHNIHVFIKKKNMNINRKNNVTEYLIIDDGDGMDSEKLENALDLGSNDFYYAQNTLSKFGLGLKSASFAQGKRLEVISGDGTGLYKESVDLDEIAEEYFSVVEPLTSEDRRLAEKYFHDGKRGTIIRISKIYTNNHPSVKTTMNNLREKIGVIYYYFLSEHGLRIFVDEEEMQPFDPLFVEEAGENNLDENEWDGKTVQWLMRPDDLLIDSESNIKGKTEITMLPHPQVRKDEGISDAEIRTKYHINANNYGFYVYRNGRLINWADKLDIIPFDQGFYAFRGRINISDDADDAFNIDVSKSHISLSEEAKNSLDDYIADYKRKCKTAWKKAYDKYNAKLSQNSNDISNDISINSEEYLDTTIDDDAPGFSEEYERRNDEIVEENRNREKEATVSRIKDEEDVDKDVSQITDEEIAQTMKGEATVSELNKIFRVPNIEDNMLWEPYVDANLKECVRISKGHRYSKLMYENNANNKDMQVLYELFLYINAKAELEVRKSMQNIDMEMVSKVLEEYRLAVSDKLTSLCRKKESELPPYLGE